MNTDVKFRAWVRGIMVEVVSIDFENKFITWFDNQYDRSENPSRLYEVESIDNVVLMRPLYRKDKKGKEIYEGDICKWPSGSTTKIVFDEKRSCFSSINIKFDSGGRYGIAASSMEVIGNIYQNPELIALKMKY